MKRFQATKHFSSLSTTLAMMQMDALNAGVAVTKTSELTVLDDAVTTDKQ